MNKEPRQNYKCTAQSNSGICFSAQKTCYRIDEERRSRKKLITNRTKRRENVKEKKEGKKEMKKLKMEDYRSKTNEKAEKIGRNKEMFRRREK